MLVKHLNRTLLISLILCYVSFSLSIIGCGEDADITEPIDGNADDLQTAGLHGDTYRNVEYLFKVSKLPTEGWTVKEVTNLASFDQLKKWKAVFDPGTKFNKMEDLLLLEPTAEADFQDTLTAAFETQTPFVFVQVEEQTATKYLTPQQYVEAHLSEMSQVYPEGSFEITAKEPLISRDRMPGYAYDVTWLEFEDEATGEKTENPGKAKEAYFMRSASTDFVYHLYFWAPVERYDELLPVYDTLLKYLELNAA